MRFRTIEVQRFGRFDDLRIELPEPRGFVLIHGPNEAGKSTLLDALRALLFGIHPQTPFGYRFGEDGYRGMGLEAEVELSDGRAVRLRRAKKRGNSLSGEWLDGDGHTIGDKALEGWLGGLDQSTYSSLFGFSHADLSGGEKVLEEKGIAELLAGGSLGGSGDRVGEVMTLLQSTADELFRPRGRKPKVNALLDEMKQLDREIAEASLGETGIIELDGRVAELRQEKAEVEEAIARIERDIQRLRRLAVVAPKLKERARLRREVGEAKADEIPCARVREAQGLLEEQRGVEELGRRLKGERDRREAALGEFVLDETLLESGPVIDGLFRRVEACREQRALLREEPEAQVEGALARDLERLRPDSEISWLVRYDEELRASREALEDRLPLWEAARDELADAERRLAAQHEEVKRVEARIEALGADEGARADALAALELRLRRGLEREDEFRRLREESARLAAALRGERRGLRSSLKTGRELPERVPDAEALQAAADACEANRAELQRLDEQRGRLRIEEKAAEGELAGFDEEGATSAVARLPELRTLRDTARRALREASENGRFDADEWDSFEAAEAEVDAACDLLRAAAEALARRTRLLEQRARLRAEVEATDRRREALLRRGRALAEKADALWEGGDPRLATVGQEFVRSFHACREHAAKHRELNERVRGLRRELRDLELELVSAFPNPGGDELRSCPQGARLAEALAIVEERKKARQRREELEHQLAELKAVLALDEASLVPLREARAAEDQIIADLGRALEVELPAEPGRMRERLRSFDALVERMKVAERDGRRRRQAEEQIAAFEGEFAELATRLDLEPMAAPAEERVLALRSKLEEERQRRSQEAQARAEFERAGAEWKANRSEASALHERIRELAGLSSEDLRDAKTVVEELATRCDRQERLSDLEAELEDTLEAGDEERLREADPETFQGEYERLEREKQELQSVRLDRLNRELGAKEEERNGLGADRGPILRARLEEKRGELEERAELSALCLSARWLLDRVLARHARENQPALLSKVGELFSGITDGRYRRVLQPLGEDTLGAEDREGRTVLPGAMSSGTREQLFLSLRLAYALDFCRTRTPLPLILDDVLVNFDQKRCANTLDALAPLGKETQILFLSCHEHLVETVRERLPDVPVVTLSP